MLDGKAFQLQFEAQSVDNLSSPAPVRRPNSATLLAALAALEKEFRSILEQTASCTSTRPEETAANN
jgi:hypothetical protein